MFHSLADILKKIVPKGPPVVSLAETWKNVASPVEREYTEVKNLKASVLLIVVKSPAIMQELKTYRKQALIDAWNRESSLRISDIKFRAG